MSRPIVILRGHHTLPHGPPLRDLIPGHVAPERLYLEARWASLVSYAAAADLLTDVLPVASGANATTLRQHVLQVAERAERELGKEQSSFIDGCPAEWAELPIPEGRIVVGLDGGYVRDWDERKTNFELIVGRSIPDDREPPATSAWCMATTRNPNAVCSSC